VTEGRVLVMNRRKALGLLGAATALAGYGRTLRAAAPNHVVVIGAGILGASIGYHLVKRGARVTILEKTRPSSGATGDSFAYLNASTKPSRPYYDLNLAGIAGWRRLQLELDGALPLQWGGAVYWRDEPAAAAQLLGSLKGYQGWGYAGRRIDEAELRRLLPDATPGHVEAAAFYDQEGTVDPAGAVDVLLGRAKAFGATVEYPIEVIGFDATSDRVRGVNTSHGKIEADAVILAAGLGSQSLANLAGVKLPLTSSAGVLVHTTPQPAFLGSVVFAPGNTIKQNPNGRVVSGGGHEGSNLTSSPQEQGEQILKDASRYFPQLKHATIENVTVGQRVLPIDGFPILGFLGSYRNLYVAATHSGVTLAPIIGQYATQEVLDGVVSDPLSPYRPGRLS
jgi:glycine/D-amino acid oxidase-like deaminating enzyme